VLLFGRKLVPRWAHFVAALMVALGTLFSAFWILSANSWMQTPQGYTIVDGRFFAVDWLAVVFNPSFPWPTVQSDSPAAKERALPNRPTRSISSGSSVG